MLLRFEIINSLIVKNGYKKYLEIGVAEKYHCFDNIICDMKHSIDPCYEFDLFDKNRKEHLNLITEDDFNNIKLKE